LIYNDEDWAIGPNFDLSSGADFTLNFDIKLTAINTILPSMMGSDDEIQLLISSDTGNSWTSLYTWDTTTPISYLGEPVSIDLSSYTGLVQIGFWASTGANNDSPGADFFVDNFVLSCTIANCPDDYSGGALPGSQPALSGLLDVDSDYETSGKIISTQLIGTIDSGINVHYDSGTEITLGPGFKTALGVEFSAFIDGCGGAAIIGNDDNSLRIEDQDSSNSSSNNFGSDLILKQAYTDDFLFYLSSHNVKLSMIVKYLMEEEHISMKAILNESGF